MSDGRNNRGQFTRGNKHGTGNPFASKVNKLRAVLLEEVKEKNLRAIIRSLVAQAEGGDLAATKILLDRVFGPAVAVDLIQRLEDLERTITGDEKQ